MTTINWTTGDGRKVELTLSADYELDRQGRRKSSGYKEVAVSATVDGEPMQGSHVVPTSHPVAVAKIGRVGLTQANYDRYLAAYAEIEATFAEHNATIDRRVSDLDAVSDEGRKLEHAMGYGEC